jgi:hypothetical protein
MRGIAAPGTLPFQGDRPQGIAIGALRAIHTGTTPTGNSHAPANLAPPAPLHAHAGAIKLARRSLR